MLQFFRKHQKVFFVFVTFFIVVSFSFFGTFSTFMNKEEVASNREIGRIIDGSILKERELIGMIHLLKNGIEEGVSSRNLLCDSFLHNEIMLSGLGEVIARQYFAELKTDLETIWKQMKHYRPYVHPQVSFINATEIWNQFAPEINTLLQQLNQAPENFSEENLSLLFSLYQAQAKFPPHLLHQMLYYQQTQNKQIPFDPALPHLNAALFGFQSIEDWLGAKFLELTSQCIINGAHIAHEQGYLVDKEEARLSLMRNVYKGLEMVLQGQKPKVEDIQNHYARQIRSLGLEEKNAIALWQQVLSFKRLLDEVGEGVFIDSLALNHFKSFADSKWKTRQFSLPKDLQCKDFRTMLKFQRYLEAVAEQSNDPLLLPQTMSDAESVAKTYPQLVCKSFEVDVASVDQEQLASQISLKQTWEWEKQTDNFALLQETFPILATKNCESGDKRLEILDELDPPTRLKIDQFARKSILSKDPESMKEALAKAEYKHQTLKVRMKGGSGPFSGEKFLQLLENDNPVHQFSEDQITYLVRVLKKGENLELVSFKEALEDGTLDELLDELLKTAHEQLKFDQPFEEVKNEVGARIYRDLLVAIEKNTGKVYEKLDDYSQDRFYAYLTQAREMSKQDPQFFESFPQDWKLIVEESFVAHASPILKVNEFSQIEEGKFYQLLEFIEGKADEKEIKDVKEELRKNAKQTLMRNLLDRFVKNDAIHLGQL